MLEGQRGPKPPLPPPLPHSFANHFPELPTLPDGATKLTDYPNSGDYGNLGSPRYSRLSIHGYTWFIDRAWWEPAEKRHEAITLINKNPGKNYGSHSVIEYSKIVCPDARTDTGSYMQTAGYMEGKPPAPLIRINSLPTLYLNIKLSQFHRLVAAEVVRAHPEIDLERSFFGNTISAGDCPGGKFDRIWITRSDLADYNRARGLQGSVVGDPQMRGNFKAGVSRTIARRIRQGTLPIIPPSVMGRFEGFWESRYKEASPITSSLTPDGERDYLSMWAPLTLAMLADKVVSFDLSCLREIAEEAWLYSNQLEILKARIEQSKIDNCSDTSKLGRLRIVCRFAQSARQRLRAIYGVTARSKFDSQSWVDLYGERLMKKILDFQLQSPGIVFHVDHIVPLAVLPKQDVIGHDSLAWHPCNLQIIPAAENVSKGSAYAGEKHQRERVNPAIQRQAAEELRRLTEFDLSESPDI